MDLQESKDHRAGGVAKQSSQPTQKSAKVGKGGDATPPLQKARETRGIKLDYSTLGDKITMSSATCHKCKVNIPLNQMNICSGKRIAKDGT